MGLYIHIVCSKEEYLIFNVFDTPFGSIILRAIFVQENLAALSVRCVEPESQLLVKQIYVDLD